MCVIFFMVYYLCVNSVFILMCVCLSVCVE